MNLIGKKFNRLTVIRKAERRGHNSRYICLCDCGKEVTIHTSNLTNNHSKSCGCFRKELAADNHRTHGHFGTPAYASWQSMKNRCNNAADISFKNYGGRGITICKEWNDSFKAFYRDMGPRPSDKTSIGRIENNLGYSPANCRWENDKEQGENKRNNHKVIINGESKNFSDWCSHFNIPLSTALQRVKYGWGDETALRTPVRPHKKYSVTSRIA
jgi:hypothetical protein